MYSQTYSDYNRRGDDAMEKKDFLMAKTFYAEGLNECNFHSISKLTDIWKTQPDMQWGLRVTIKRCRKCLVTLSEGNDTYASNAKSLLADYLERGLGGDKDSIQAKQLRIDAAAILGLNIVTENKGNTGDSLITVPIVTQNPDPISPPLRFSEKYTLFIAYTFSPTMPAGINIGIFNKFGVMLGFKSSLQKRPDSEYNCNNSTIFDINTNTYSYAFTQKEKWHSTMFTAQVLFPVITKQLFISAGGGYGKRDLFNNAELYDKKTGLENSNIWCYNTQGSYKGAVVEAGVLYKHKHLIVMGGINSVSFKDLDGYVGIGYSF